MQPLFIGPQELGVQRNLKPFMIPNEAFVELDNAYLFRGRVTKKRGYTTLGRLRRVLTAASLGNVNLLLGPTDLNIFTLLGVAATEPNAMIESSAITNINIAIGAQNLTGTTGSNTLTVVGAGNIISANLNFATGVLTVISAAPFGPVAATITGAYYPGLPVMGILRREIPTINSEQRIIFDTKYAYQYVGIFSELPSTLPVKWSGTDYNLFWYTNYWQDTVNNNLFWTTNSVAGLHAYAVTLFGGAAGGPPSTVNVTAAGNTFNVGDTVYFLNLTGAGAANNLLTGTVTVAGDPIFTISNPGTGVFVNGAVTGLVVSSDVNVAGQDGIRYYNGTTWKNYNPAINTTTALIGCLAILPYKGRLLFFNTIEGNDLGSASFHQRVRWTQIGSPLDLTLSARSDLIGRGGFLDASTNEQLISVGFVKDELIAYFESSTWKLIYTGNEVLPFQWQKINTELGAESTFSYVNFDNALLAFGNVGLHSTNSISVERIDQQIPDEVFSISNLNNGVKRVYGIRDYFLQLAYWAYNDFEDNGQNYTGTFPNRVMVYNYIENSFSFFRESFTCFGYWPTYATYTWATLPYDSWQTWTIPWGSGNVQKDFPAVAAGNQQGYVVQLSTEEVNVGRTRAITNFVGNVITSPNHNLYVGDTVLITGCLGTTDLNGQAVQVIVADANTITISDNSAGIYQGLGELTLLPNINISTKMFTPFWDYSRRYRLKYAEFLFDRTPVGEVTSNLLIDTADSYSVNDPTDAVNLSGGVTSLLGNNTIFTKPETLYAVPQSQQSAIWHRQYYAAEGETFQVVISLSPDQMQNLDVAKSDVVLHAMIFHFEPAGTFR